MIDFYTTKIIKRSQANLFFDQALNIITILNIQDRTQRGDRGEAIAPSRKLYLRFLECH